MQTNNVMPRNTNWGIGGATANKAAVSGDDIVSFGYHQAPLTNAKQADKIRNSLTEEQKQQLRDKYDINNMELNSPEHKALRKELRDLGVISEEDYAASEHPLTYVDDAFTIKRQEDLPPWDMHNVGNDMYKYYFHGKDGFMESYGKIIASQSDRSFDETMQMADGQLRQADAFSHIADALKEIFM